MVLLSQGADVNAKDQWGNTALIKAAAKTDMAGNAEQTRAVTHHKIKVVKLLLTHHADVNARNDQGSTALMCAARDGQLEASVLLERSGAKH
jgi:ankyrin repeat protein